MFGREGNTLVSHGFDEAAIVWDLANNGKQYPPLLSGDHVIASQLSPDGSAIATSSNDGGARIWDRKTGKLIATLEHPGWVLAISFSPDGSRLLTSCKDGLAREWDWREAKLAHAPLKQRGQMLDAKYTPDGEWIVTCTRRGDVRIWNAKLGLPVGGTVNIDGECFCIHVTPDSQKALVTGQYSAIFAISLRPLYEFDRDNGDSARLAAELMSGSRIEDGGTVNLTTSEWLDRWQQLVEQQELPSLN
jgi:WD40 repeat protein